MQEPILFNKSIKGNIKYGKADATDEEIYKAALTANAVDFIESSSQEALTKEQRTEKIDKEFEVMLYQMKNYPQIKSIKNTEWQEKQKELILEILKYSDEAVLNLIESKIQTFIDMIQTDGMKDGTKWDDIILRMEWLESYESMLQRYKDKSEILAVLE